MKRVIVVLLICLSVACKSDQEMHFDKNKSFKITTLRY